MEKMNSINNLTSALKKDDIKIHNNHVSYTKINTRIKEIDEKDHKTKFVKK